MIYFKILLVFLAISEISYAARKVKNFEPYIRYKSIKCAGSPKSVSSYKCFIKAYSRQNTTLNIIANISRPFYNSIVTYDFNYKSISNSMRSIINATGDICQFLNGTKNHPVIDWVLGMMPKFKKFIHPCPYEGYLEMKDLQIDIGKAISIFPAGIYVTFMKFRDYVDENAFSMNFTQEIVSKDRNEF